MSPKAPAQNPALAILATISSAEELDQIHLSLVQLLDMANDGELDLILDQSSKTAKQKELFLTKVVDSLASAELKKELHPIVKSGNFDFFSKRNLSDWAEALEREAEDIEVINLQVALDFKPKEVREFIEVLSKKIGHPVALNIKVDHSLVGGAIIQHGNYLSDYSVKTRLDQFRSSWHRAVIGK